MIIMVSGNGTASVMPLLDSKVTHFWTLMAKHPTSLATAARCVPGFALTLYGSSPSGRSMATHVAAANNIGLVKELVKANLFDLVSSTVLRQDCSGMHALDFALKQRNAALCELLLNAALRLPPPSRLPMVSAPAGTPSAFVVIAKVFPAVLCRQLNKLGLDPYQEEGISWNEQSKCIKRVPQAVLQLDHMRMNIASATSPFLGPRLPLHGLESPAILRCAPPHRIGR
jgi:hypothetical protein